MTRHPRARVFGAGVFLAVVGGSLVVAPTAALAAQPTVRVLSPGSNNLRPGESTTVTFRVTNNKGEDFQSLVTTEVSGFNELSCVDRCTFKDEILTPDGFADHTVTLVAGNVGAGQKKSGTVRITATSGSAPAAETSFGVTVRGPDAVQRISGLKGKVRDSFGAAVPGAQVAYSDSQGHRGETTSNDSGNFSFESTDQNPISPGRIEVGARKDGFGFVTAAVNGQAGKSARTTLTLPAAAGATPSATPSASTSPSAEASEEASPEATAEGTPAAAAPVANNADDEGSSSLIFIIAGGLLVAVGIGAIVLVFIRRKDKDAEDEDDLAAVPAAAAAAPASRYGDATRVAPATRVGGLPAADATMVTGGPVPPALANAQTMLQQAVPAEDEFPDPYGAPRPASGPGYGARTQTWNPPAQAGAPGAYGAPAPAAYEPPAYGSPAGPAQRFDEPTGRYNPAADRGPGTYGAAAQPQPQPGYGGGNYGARGDDPYQSGGYPQAGGTYGGGYEPTRQQQGGYGTGLDPAGTGYGLSGSYGSTRSYGGAPQDPGNDQPTTYGPPGGGHDQRGTHGRPETSAPGAPGAYGPRPGGAGYGEPGYHGDQQHGGQQQGGHYGEDPAQPGRRAYEDDQRGYDGRQAGTSGQGGGQRRSLDWLDD